MGSAGANTPVLWADVAPSDVSPVPARLGRRRRFPDHADRCIAAFPVDAEGRSAEGSPTRVAVGFARCPAKAKVSGLCGGHAFDTWSDGWESRDGEPIPLRGPRYDHSRREATDGGDRAPTTERG